MVEGARLESVYTSKAYRGFESLPLRHLLYFNDHQRPLANAESPVFARIILNLVIVHVRRSSRSIVADFMTIFMTCSLQELCLR